MKGQAMEDTGEKAPSNFKQSWGIFLDLYGDPIKTLLAVFGGAVLIGQGVEKIVTPPTLSPAQYAEIEKFAADPLMRAQVYEAVKDGEVTYAEYEYLLKAKKRIDSNQYITAIRKVIIDNSEPIDTTPKT